MKVQNSQKIAVPGQFKRPLFPNASTAQNRQFGPDLDIPKTFRAESGPQISSSKEGTAFTGICFIRVSATIAYIFFLSVMLHREWHPAQKLEESSATYWALGVLKVSL